MYGSAPCISASVTIAGDVETTIRRTHVHSLLNARQWTHQPAATTTRRFVLREEK